MSTIVKEGAPVHGIVAHLLPPHYTQQVTAWLEEDIPSFDYGGFVVGEEYVVAKLLGKSEVSLTNSLHLLLIEHYYPFRFLSDITRIKRASLCS
jgi:hypothetical protein